MMMCCVRGSELFAGERNIKALRVKCGNSSNGCAWVGEMGSLDKHQDTCSHTLLACPNECIDGTTLVRVLRKDLATHLKKRCPNRSHKCPHCKRTGKHCDITTSHLDTCTKLKVPCPNKGCSAKLSRCREKLPRCEIRKHRKTCPFEEVACKYRKIGCKDKPLRKEMKDHENNDQLHLHIAMETILKREDDVSQMQTQLAEHHIRTTASDQFTFKMAKFSQYNESGKVFFSPPFYTHHGGYKMCIGVVANGDDADTHIAVHAYLMRGENDDNLIWPFTGGITVELLNQLKDKEHYQETITFPKDKDDDTNRRVVDRDRAPGGWGRPKFISHTALSFNPLLYWHFLKDDCLYFRISVKATPNPKPWLTCTS